MQYYLEDEINGGRPGGLDNPIDVIRPFSGPVVRIPIFDLVPIYPGEPILKGRD